MRNVLVFITFINECLTNGNTSYKNRSLFPYNVSYRPVLEIIRSNSFYAPPFIMIIQYYTQSLSRSIGLRGILQPQSIRARTLPDTVNLSCSSAALSTSNDKSLTSFYYTIRHVLGYMMCSGFNMSTEQLLTPFAYHYFRNMSGRDNTSKSILTH